MGKGAKKDEFAAVMKLLSAEAEKTLPEDGDLVIRDLPLGSDAADIAAEFRALDSRLQSLEKALSERFDKLATSLPKELPDVAELANRFQKVDDQLSAIRSSETVNQRLFDSLHDELLKYRDNFLHESLQKPFIHDLVHLYDDLIGLSAQLQAAAEEKGGKRGHISQWRDNLENTVISLLEILHRFDVKEIEAKEVFDRALHRVISYEPADYPEEDGRIMMRVKRGFLWRGKLIRPEEVIVKRYG
jgi:molecular chaperone GrpE (heat shock protein)